MPFSADLFTQRLSRAFGSNLGETDFDWPFYMILFKELTRSNILLHSNNTQLTEISVHFNTFTCISSK